MADGWERVDTYYQQRGDFRVSAARVGDRWRFSAWRRAGERWECLGVFDEADEAKAACDGGSEIAEAEDLSDLQDEVPTGAGSTSEGVQRSVCDQVGAAAEEGCGGTSGEGGAPGTAGGEARSSDAP